MHTLTRTLCIAAFAAMASPAFGQTMSFRFAAPTATMTANFDVKLLTGGLAVGYRQVDITPATLPTVRKLIPKHMLQTFTTLQPGTPLRAKIDRLMQFSKSHGQTVNVRITLFDDNTSVASTDRVSTQPDTSGVFFVWPAASVQSTAANTFSANIEVGEIWAQALTAKVDLGWKFWEAVLLHETLHTQFVGEGTKWGSITVAYGLDESHQFSEILGAQDIAFEEGLGNFFGFTHFHPNGFNEATAFFNNTGARYIFEDGSIPASWKDLRQAATSSEERKIPTPVGTAQPTRTSYTRYKAPWLRVPGKYLLFNEWSSTGFHVFFWQQSGVDPDLALRMIEESSRQMSTELRRRNLAYAVNSLALQMEAHAATPAGQTMATAGTLTSSMFTVALLDLLTHFGMADAEFQLEFTRNNLNPRSLAIAEYWKHRAAVRALAEPQLKANAISIHGAIGAIRGYFTQKTTILTKP